MSRSPEGGRLDPSPIVARPFAGFLLVHPEAVIREAILGASISSSLAAPSQFWHVAGPEAGALEDLSSMLLKLPNSGLLGWRQMERYLDTLYLYRGDPVYTSPEAIDKAVVVLQRRGSILW